MPPPYCYDHPRPAVTVDLAVFAVDGDGLRVLLVRRKHDPFAGSWALPGGFLDVDEPIEDAARRELAEEAGFRADGPLSFLGVYGDPGRDPRGRTISLAHVAVLRGPCPAVEGGDDAAEAAWRPARGPEVAPLAFDHRAILDRALAWLEAGIRSGPVALAILPEEFDEAGVEALFVAVFGEPSGAASWLGRMAGEGRIAPQPGATRAAGDGVRN